VAHGSMQIMRCSVTLVRDGDFRCLVDPGGLDDMADLEASLRAAGASLEEINAVYFTHLHFDHYKLFPWSERVARIFLPEPDLVYMRALAYSRHDREDYLAHLLSTHEHIAPVFLRQFWRFAADARFDFDRPLDRRIRVIRGGERLSDHCTTVPLPGHCPGLIGLQADLPEAVHLICADAVLDEEDYLKERPRLIMHDSEASLRSRARLRRAQVLHPGHGRPFTLAPEEKA
jgi:glyoxylase-like metal-dependent hydrolase (beta-lactamase superfamily II)